MADGDYDFLSGLSAHPNRPGDVSNFNPAFASRLTTALQQARAAGLPLGIESGYRDPGQTGSAYDAGGNSSHTYGLASDISGLDGPNGKITNQWAQIAQANGLHNPYGVGNTAEFNHWQLPASPLEQQPALLASLKAAKATGNMQNVWNAYNGGSTSAAAVPTGSPIAPNPQPINTTINSTPFSLPSNAPMGMRNNNPLNIKYYQGAPYAGLVGPSANTDQGDPQMVFKDPQSGWNAAYSLLSKKYGQGMTTPDAIIAGKGGWTPGNTAAAANVAKAAGVGPDQDIGFSDPAKATKFMRALVTQEQGGAGSAYPDAMIASAISGAQNAPVSTTPGTASAGASGSAGSAAATAVIGALGTPAGPALPGMNQQQSTGFLQGASGLDKAMGGQGLASQGGGGDQQQQRPPSMPPAQPPHIPNPSQAAQTFGQTLNSMRTGPQWGPNPIGSPIYATAGLQGPEINPQEQQMLMQMMMGGGMGTSLNSPYGGYGYG